MDHAEGSASSRCVSHASKIGSTSRAGPARQPQVRRASSRLRMSQWNVAMGRRMIEAVERRCPCAPARGRATCSNSGRCGASARQTPGIHVSRRTRVTVPISTIPRRTATAALRPLQAVVRAPKHVEYRDLRLEEIPRLGGIGDLQNEVARRSGNSDRARWGVVRQRPRRRKLSAAIRAASAAEKLRRVADRGHRVRIS